MPSRDQLRMGYAGAVIRSHPIPNPSPPPPTITETWDTQPLLKAQVFTLSRFAGFRQELRWIAIEDENHPGYDPGEPDTWKWSAASNPLDKVTGTGSGAMQWGFPGAGVLPQVTTTPRQHRRTGWDGPGLTAGEYSIVQNVERYGVFCAEAFTRVLRPRGIYTWEVINEPNIFRNQAFSKALRQEVWAEMCEAAGRHIRAACPAAERHLIRIVSGGLANAGPGLGNAEEWLAAAIAHFAGGPTNEFLDQIDAVGYHPYGLIQRNGGPGRDGSHTPNYRLLDPTRAGTGVRSTTVVLANMLYDAGYPDIAIDNTESGGEHHPWAITGHGLAMTTVVDASDHEQYFLPVRDPRNIHGNLIRSYDDCEELPPGQVWFRGCASEAELAWAAERVLCFWHGLALPSLTSHPAPVDQAGRAPLVYPRTPTWHNWKGTGPTQPGWKRGESAPGAQDGNPNPGPWWWYRHIDFEVGVSPENTSTAEFKDINPFKGHFMTPAGTKSAAGTATPLVITAPTLKTNPVGGDDVESFLKRFDLTGVLDGPPPRPGGTGTRRVVVSLAGSGTGQVTSDVHNGSSIDTAATPPRMEVTVDIGDTVVLTADPDGSDTFGGWAGAFSGTTNPKSHVVNAQTLVTATFVASAGTQHGMGVSVSPSTAAGQVVSDPVGIDTDGADFSHSYPEDDTVELTATDKAGYDFVRFSGSPAQSVVGQVGTWVMDGPKLVTVEFALTSQNASPAPATVLVETIIPAVVVQADEAPGTVKIPVPLPVRSVVPISASRARRATIEGGAPASGAPRMMRDRLVFPASGQAFAMWSYLSLPPSWAAGTAFDVSFEFRVSAYAGNPADNVIAWLAGVAFPPPGTPLNEWVLPTGTGQNITAPSGAGAALPATIVVQPSSDAAPNRSMVVWIGRFPAAASDTSPADAFVESAILEYRVSA